MKVKIWRVNSLFNIEVGELKAKTLTLRGAKRKAKKMKRAAQSYCPDEWYSLEQSKENPYMEITYYEEYYIK